MGWTNRGRPITICLIVWLWLGAGCGTLDRPEETTAQRRVRYTKRTLAARGLVEAVTWSFIPESHAALFGGGDESLRLANPISSELTDMRPSLLPGLMAAVARTCRAEGGRWMFWSVLKRNRAGRRFYRTMAPELKDIVVCATLGEAFDRLADANGEEVS